MLKNKKRWGFWVWMGMLLLPLFILSGCGGGGGNGGSSGGGGFPYTIGGTVSGLNDGASVTLQDNSGDSLKLTSNYSFTLPTALSTGSAYTVTVASAEPAGESCTVANGSGTIGTANVSNVNVMCNGAGYYLAAGDWTSVSGGLYSGGSYPYTAGIYGTQGVAAPGNVPGMRNNAVSWTDTAGNLWLFGGGGSSSSTAGVLNDLWKFTPSTGLWTWVSGSNTANAIGIYGTQGVAAAGNVPGARGGSVSWTDTADNLWLFGGGNFNDLWKFSPSTGLWTWISGSNTINAAGVYGTQGVAAAGNVPGARSDSVSWIDASGNLWLFGGSSDGISYLNDLWKFSPSTGLWTWVGGSNAINAAGVYGTQGIAATGNVPGAREYAVSWTDTAGNLWLFGGVNGSSSFRRNDLWKFSPSTGLWTWVSGSNTANAIGVYGTQGVAAVGNVPGARYGSVSWIDSAGNLWLFGGDDSYNDLWKFSPASSLWTWVNGSNTATTANVSSTYGTQGVPASDNAPGARAYAVSWKDAAGNFWLFGGYNYYSPSGSDYNELWAYKP
ncbi:MAG: Kelch repeat-containing protein [Burkholderiales bacterium]